MSYYNTNRGVLAIRIYFDEMHMGTTPMAELYMADGVMENIEWNNAKQRKQFETGINGYTLIYDERPKASWKEFTGRDVADGM